MADLRTSPRGEAGTEFEWIIQIARLCESNPSPCQNFFVVSGLRYWYRVGGSVKALWNLNRVGDGG